ncbi:hypothetical protein M758_7G015700 [Ceratodon purpureus]|nr:hypothetical protein M758_7G015700 [Ceratodon purpureus]
MLESLSVYGCRRLEALPDTVSALSKLSGLYMWACSPSMSKLPLMTGVTGLMLDLANEEQAGGIGKLLALKVLGLMEQTTDEAITALDSLGTLTNLRKLFTVQFMGCTPLTKIPETIGQLTRLDILELLDCENLQQLPNSICQLKLLWRLRLVNCNNVKTLPDSLGEMTNLQYLWIYKCKLFAELPQSIGQLPRLRELRIQGCNNLQSLPDSMRHLSTLCLLEVFDCGILEGLGALRMLRGFRLWGCTSVTELPGSCLRVLDSDYFNPTWFSDLEGIYPIPLKLKDLGLVEETACGALRLVQEDAGSRRTILQRVQNLRCSNPMVATPPYHWPTYYWSSVGL